MSERLDKARSAYLDAKFVYDDTDFLVISVRDRLIAATREYRAALAEESDD